MIFRRESCVSLVRDMKAGSQWRKEWEGGKREVGHALERKKEERQKEGGDREPETTVEKDFGGKGRGRGRRKGMEVNSE